MLRRGSRGAEVRRLQQELKRQGLYTGAIDGIFGPLTHNAVVAYQRSNNLQVDGIAGPQTLGHLGLTGGGGGSSGGSGSGGGKQSLNGVPGEAEVWKIGGSHYLMYETPKNGVPIMYRMTSSEFKALSEGGATVRINRTFSNLREAQKSTGAIEVGVRSELSTDDDHPFRSLVAKFDRLTVSQPWLKDPEVLALYSAAMLEGRTLTEAELKSTKWYQNRSEGERRWAVTSLSDPATAAQIIKDNRNTVLDTARSLGISNLPSRVVDWISTQWTEGKWTQSYTVEQIRRMADPFRAGKLDSGLQQQLKNVKYSTTREHEDTVTALVSEWLGPHVAAGWSKSKIREWAGKLRNDPNAQQNLVDSLRKQRLAKYKAYEDINTTYADIDALWRPLFRQMWGQDPEHGSAAFEKVLQVNDQAEAERYLRRRGLEQGNRSIGINLLSQLNSTLGGHVREMA